MSDRFLRIHRLKHYKAISVWENRRRLLRLSEFGQHLQEYLAHMGSAGDETKRASARSAINMSLQETIEIVEAANVSLSISYTPSPLAGGRTTYTNLMHDIFNLPQFPGQDPYGLLIDRIQRAYGVYVANDRASLLRTLNPIWWVFQVLELLLRLPFYALGAAGFDSNRIEASALGRLLKLAIMLLTSAASTIYLLDVAGLIDI